MAYPKRVEFPISAEALYDLPRELPGVGARFYELNHGELLVREPGGVYHSSTGSRLLARLLDHVEQHQLGLVVGADVGFVLHRNPDTVRSPDVAFIRAARIPSDDVIHLFFEGAPDLAVEVLSPSDRRSKIHAKTLQYLDAGTSLVWILDPKLRQVTVHQRETIPLTLRDGDKLDGGSVIPDLQISVGSLFR